MAPSGCECRRCGVFLAGALVLDAVGLALVLAGTVGRPLNQDGLPYEDFLAQSGGLLLFLSLLCWLIWYSGNLRGMADEELPLDCRPIRPTPGPAAAPRSHASLLRLAAKLSERLSQRPRRSPPASLAGTLPVRTSEEPLELSRLPSRPDTAERLV